jgi:hypothetical protein
MRREKPESPLDENPTAVDGPTQTSDAGHLPIWAIHNFRIMRKLGEGGMGVSV